MEKKIKISLIFVAVAAVAIIALAVFATQDNDNPGTLGQKHVNSTVYLGNSEDLTTYEGYGNTVEMIIQSALADHDVVYRSNGNIESVDGIANTDDMVWTVFKWTAPQGWTTLEDAMSSSVYLPEGVNLAVYYASKTWDSNQSKWIYAAPDEVIEYTVYFFLQFREHYDSDKIIAGNLSEYDRQNGVWIKGTGQNTMECLEDAIFTYIFPDYTGDKNEVILYPKDAESFGNLYYFLGWSDTQLPNGSWTYWSQYRYNPDAESLDDKDEWSYNDFYLGRFDITENRYFALILQTTAEMDDEGTYYPDATPADIPAGL